LLTRNQLLGRAVGGGMGHLANTDCQAQCGKEARIITFFTFGSCIKISAATPRIGRFVCASLEETKPPCGLFAALYKKSCPQSSPHRMKKVLCGAGE
jgi:hypothetical protein